MVTEDRNVFAPGDWIVHESHGIGQIVAIESNSIGDKETTYYRIDMDNSTIWVPLGGEELLRDLASPEEFAQAVAILQRPSRRMSSAYRSRLARIRKAKDKGTPKALARMVRDLWARQKRQGKLSKTENQALRDMLDQLLAEWSISTGMDESKTSEKVFSLLHQNAMPAATS